MRMSHGIVCRPYNLILIYIIFNGFSCYGSIWDELGNFLVKNLKRKNKLASRSSEMICLGLFSLSGFED